MLHCTRALKADSPLCEHWPEEETPSHNLLKCRYYEEERHNLKEELGRLNIKQVAISTLLTNQLATSFSRKNTIFLKHNLTILIWWFYEEVFLVRKYMES